MTVPTGPSERKPLAEPEAKSDILPTGQQGGLIKRPDRPGIGNESVRPEVVGRNPRAVQHGCKRGSRLCQNGGQVDERCRALEDFVLIDHDRESVSPKGNPVNANLRDGPRESELRGRTGSCRLYRPGNAGHWTGPLWPLWGKS